MLKICGATTPEDVELLAAAGADLVGLWHGIRGGQADLSVATLTALAAAARDTARAEPVIVTFLKDADVLAGLVARTGARWVQLHAYQPPGVVRALKAAAPGVAVAKVIHVQGATCLEERFIGAYERAGTDCFLLDAATDDGRVGSTGERLDSRAVTALADRLARPFLLAGGISDELRPDDKLVVDHPRFLGVDVDSGARHADGRFDPARVAAIRSCWRVRGVAGLGSVADLRGVDLDDEENVA
jgi:phosphoribosylanthranilate isomerase